jgi:hypothetical protein
LNEVFTYVNWLCKTDIKIINCKIYIHSGMDLNGVKITRASNKRKLYTIFVGKSLEKGPSGTPWVGGMGGGDEDGSEDRDCRK